MYKYDSIPDDHIRLLRWIGGDIPTLQFALESYTLPIAKQKAYVAVSYRWTDLSHARSVILNEYDFKISEDLWLCLWNIIHSHEVGTKGLIWVDFICINQRNLSERASQVSMMGQIYTNADMVAVWLSYDRLPSLPSSVQRLDAPYEIASSIDGGVRTLVGRDYWSRVWVIQEFMLARQQYIFWNGYHMTWATMKAAIPISIRHVKPYTTTLLPFLGTMPPCALVRASTDSERPYLHELLKRHQYTHCHDPRDRVFSMLSLVPERERAQLRKFFPDYTMSVKEVAIILLAHYSRDPQYDEIQRQVWWSFRVHRFDLQVHLVETAATLDLDSVLGWHDVKHIVKACSARYSVTKESRAELGELDRVGFWVPDNYIDFGAEGSY
jgi:hypothetical protein